MEKKNIVVISSEQLGSGTNEFNAEISDSVEELISALVSTSIKHHEFEQALHVAAFKLKQRKKLQIMSN